MIKRVNIELGTYQRRKGCLAVFKEALKLCIIIPQTMLINHVIFMRSGSKPLIIPLRDTYGVKTFPP